MAQNNQQNTSTPNTSPPANNNNAPAGSLLRRTTNTNQPQTNNTPAPANNTANNTANNNANPFNSRLNRFANNNNATNTVPDRPTWTITPMSMAGVRIELEGLGDPFFRILNTPLDKTIRNVNSIMQKMNDDKELFQQLSDELDRRWEKIGLKGAVLLYSVHKNVQQAFSEVIMPILPASEDLNYEDDNNNQAQAPAQASQNNNLTSPYQMFRAIDPALIINILGRVRGNVLAEGTPLALEEAFLRQSFLCDDERIVELALSTGAIEEVW